MEIVSDSVEFHVVMSRRISRDGRTVRTRSWRETLPRVAH
jgi:hypothetical protein